MNLPVFVYPDESELVITYDAQRAAIKSSWLIEKFAIAITNNAQKGMDQLANNVFFDNFVLPEIEVERMRLVMVLSSKQRMGPRLRTEPSYAEQIARLSIQEAVGLSTLTALIPAKLTDGVLDPIDDNYINAAVSAQSNDLRFFEILEKQRLI